MWLTCIYATQQRTPPHPQVGKALKSIEEVEAELAKQKAATKELKDATKAVQANRQKVRGPSSHPSACCCPPVFPLLLFLPCTRTAHV